MSHYTVDYRGDNNDQRALRDLVQWYGFRKSRFIFAECRNAKTFADLDNLDRALSFSGCQGHPVICLFRRFHGEEAIARWRTMPDFSQERIAP